MYLLFDIGGTNTRIAISGDGKTLADTKIFPTEQDFEAQVQQISQTTDKLIHDQKMNEFSSSKIEVAAGGVAGSLDKAKSLLLTSPHLESWSHKPLKEELERVFDCAVCLENDASLGGLGEAVYGAGKDANIVAFITIGTGVGGVRIVNQKIDNNALGFEPGHQIIYPGGNQCNCGGKGHLETYVSGAYLKEPINWEELAKYLAIGLNNTIVHWSPDIVIVSGAIGQKIPLDKVEENLKKLLTIFPFPIKLVKGSNEHEAGLLGALAYITDHTSET